MSSPSASPPVSARRAERDSKKGIVAAGHACTAQAAREVMAAGGNAVDAVVAALWAACVVEPVLASPGGGGFILDAPREGEACVHDFFVHTPRVQRPADEIDFHEVIADFGVAQQAFHIGYGSAAAPGFVRGLFAVHRARGVMPMTRLVEPAVAAAKEGVALGPYEAYLLSVVGPIYQVTPAARALFTRTPADAETPELLREGDVLRNPALADTLEALAREGDALFYEGELAALMERACLDLGGHLTREDLSSYRAYARAPLTRRYRGATLTTNPPPALGGLLIAHSLELLERHGAGFGGGAGSPAHAATLARVMRATNRARAAVLDEARGQKTPRELLEILEDDALAPYVAALRELADTPVAPRGTTHISVIDGEGNAAAATVSNGEGCGHLVPGTGFMLNNMLGEEDINPRGLGSWEPDLRMASMMAPSAVTTPDGGLVVLGSGGSNRIRTAILQVLVNAVDFGMDPRAAVDAPRLHHERDHLDFEALLPAETQRALEREFASHLAWPKRNMYFGGVHTVQRLPDGTLRGAGDPRRAGVCL